MHSILGANMLSRNRMSVKTVVIKAGDGMMTPL